MTNDEKLEQLLVMMEVMVSTWTTLAEELQADSKCARDALKALIGSESTEADTKLDAARVLLSASKETVREIAEGMGTFMKFAQQLAD